MTEMKGAGGKVRGASREEVFSTDAEQLFFAHPDRTVAEWTQLIDQGRIDDRPLSQQLQTELRHLVRCLERVTASEEVADVPEDTHSASLRLGVMGRDGSSYELISRLGTGGHSIVYRGLQREPFERPVAVKVYYASATDLTAIDGLRELNVIRRLNHPGVCQVLDAGITPWQQPFLVLELIEGDPLHRFVSQRGLSCNERLQLFGEILDVVIYAHGQGVVHRDLKPQNILVHAASGRVKLIDFSISAIDDLSENTRSGKTARGYGTREYQSPEQAGLTSSPVDTRSDVYSLGCVLFELLTGERVLPRANAPTDAQPRTVAARNWRERLMGVEANCVPASHRKALAAIVERCLATSPKDRFPSAVALKAHLDAVVAGDPLPLPRRRRAAWGRRQPVAAAAIVVVVLVAAGVYLAQPPGSPQARSVQAARGSALPADNLLLQAEQMVARLEANVVKSDLPATRSAAAALVEAFDREQLLFTTPTGLMLLARYIRFLNTAFGSEGRDESDSLLAQRVESPETLLAIDPTAGAMLLLETMLLPLSSNQPDAALAVSAVLEEHGILQMSDELAGRWGMLTSEALIRSGRLDEAFATLAQVVDLPGELPDPWRMAFPSDQAMIREQQGREEDAIAILRPHLQAQPPRSKDEAHFAYSMHLQAGRCFLKLGRPEEAMPLLQHAVTLTEPWPEAVPPDATVVAWLLLGEAQEGVGDPASAAASYRTALANLRQLAGKGTLPKGMLTELGPELQERIDRLEPGMSGLVVE